MTIHSFWLQDKSVNLILSQLRSDLHHATKLEADAPLASNKICLNCGQAMYNETKRCWVLHHTDILPTSASATVAKSSATKSNAAQSARTGRLVARIAPNPPLTTSTSTTGDNPTRKRRTSGSNAMSTISPTCPQTTSYSSPPRPPLPLVQAIFRAIELRAILENAKNSIMQGPRPTNPPHYISRTGEKTNLSPLLTLATEDTSNRGTPAGRRSRSQLSHELLLQKAMAMCNPLSLDHSNVHIDNDDENSINQYKGSWKVELENHLGEPDTMSRRWQQNAFDRMQEMISYCLLPTTSGLEFDHEGNRTGNDGAMDEPHDALDSHRETRLQLAGEDPAPNQSAATRRQPTRRHNQEELVQSTRQHPGQSSIGTITASAIGPALISTRHSGHTAIGAAHLSTDLIATVNHGCSETDNQERVAPSHGVHSLRRSPRKQFKWVEGVAPSPEKPAKLEMTEQQQKKKAKKPKISTSGRVLNQALTSKDNHADNSIIPASTSNFSRSKEPEHSPSITWQGTDAKQELPHVRSKHDRNSHSQLVENPDVPEELKWRRWVKLSHVGHVSDYHGLQREHDSTFLPLVFNKSVVAMSSTIDSVLKEHGFDKDDESDQEISQEIKSYEKLVSAYQKKANKEKLKRQMLVRRKNNPTPVEPLNLPIIFSSQNKHSHNELEKAATSSMAKLDLAQLPTDILNPTFRELNEEPLDLGMDEETVQKKRVSRRSAELVTQRKASLYILSQLRHRLQFISSYNDGFPRNSAPQPVDTNNEISEEPVEILHPRKRPRLSNNGTKSDIWNQETQQHVANLPVDPTSIQIDYSGLLDQYKALGQQRLLRPMLVHVRENSLEALKDSITKVMDKCVPPENDEEFAAQEKRTWMKIVRGYNSRADQERIEKKEHEEARALKLREIAYETRGDKTAKHAQKELERFASKRILFSHGTKQRLGKTVETPCDLGDNCLICYTSDGDSKVLPRQEILRPQFRMIQEDDWKESQTGGRRSRAKERALEQEQAFEQVEDLYRRVKFVEQYNSGWVETTKHK